MAHLLRVLNLVFAEEHGIKHQRITLWPQANSEAECLMKPLSKTYDQLIGRVKKDIKN